MTRPLFVAVAALLVLVPLVPSGAAQTETQGSIETPPSPAGGTYLMKVRVENFMLTDPPAGGAAPNEPGRGHIVYTLNGAVCAAAANCGGPYATASATFEYKGLVPGDVVCAELVNHDGSSLEPRILMCESVGPTRLRITSAQPAVGEGKLSRDATVTVDVKGFVLRPVPTAATPLANEPLAGHVMYLLQRPGETSPTGCIGGCSGGTTYETHATSFTYRGVRDGDRLVVRLVNHDGSRLANNLEQVQIVGAPTVTAVSEPPRLEGDYTLRVAVANFLLTEAGVSGPTQAAQAGTGHIHYLIKRKDAASFVPCEAACAGGQPYATTALSFAFQDLKDGDEVAAELVTSDHHALSPAVRVTVTFAEKILPVPGFEFAFLALILAGLAVLRRR